MDSTSNQAKGPLRLRREMPDLFQGAEKKKRPASVTISRQTPEQLYAFFSDLGNFPRIAPEFRAVEGIGRGRARWHKGTGAHAESWETEMVLDQPNECLAWRTVPDSSHRLVSALTFEPSPDGRGTVVGYKVCHLSPGAGIFSLGEKLRGEDPDLVAYATLRRLKALLETGETPTTEGQPSGRDESAAA